MAQKTEGRLSPREQEVARMVAQGLTNREIGEKLFISERTVDGHLEHIREKLGVNSRAQVSAWVVRNETTAQTISTKSKAASRRLIAHPRLWVASALLLAVLAAMVGVLRLTEPPPPRVETVAGTDCPRPTYPGGCYGGDNELATKAQLARPTSVAVDSKGVLYIADFGNQLIRKVEAGVITTVVGGGNKKLAEGVLGIAVSHESLGNISAVAVAPGDGLDLLTSREGVLEVWNETGGYMHLVVTIGHANVDVRQIAPNLPVGALAITKSGVLFISDRAGNRVLRFDGQLAPYAGTGDAGFTDGGDALSARLDWPIGLALDARENLYIADTGNNRIRKVDHVKRTISTVAGSGQFEGDGGDGGRAVAASLSFPFGLAIAKDGEIVFTDTGNHRLRVVTSRGDIDAFAGTGHWGFSGDGLATLGSEFNAPEGLALDNKGDLYVADTENQRIREIAHVFLP